MNVEFTSFPPELSPDSSPDVPLDALAPHPVVSVDQVPAAAAFPARLRRLVGLFHRRWSVPILAALDQGEGGRFVTLAATLEVNRESLRDTLDDLIRRGWVMRNPGHGHPLRPEYLLTDAGCGVAPTCAALLRTLDRAGIVRPGLRKWSMPVAMAVNWGAERFGSLRAMLPEATNRALALALKDMQAADVIDRRVVDHYPPMPLYALTRRGRRLATMLGEL
jgi:DNA-binding HxlR family transcriptional regulator